MAAHSGLPTEMKAAAIDHYGPPDVVHTATVPVPQLGRNEILIRVEAAGIGEWEPSLIEGSFTDVKRRLPTIFGADGAGTVIALGRGASRFEPGEQVYGWGWANKKGGFFAEYAVVKEREASTIPKGMSI